MRKLIIFIKHPESLISLAVILLLLAVFVPSLPVLAAPVVILVPASGAVGTAITISGTVFDSYKGDSIHIFFDATEIEKSPVVIPQEAAFSVDFTIPADATTGQHWIEVRSETTSTSMLAKNFFTVEAITLTLATPEGSVGDSINISGAGFYVGKPVTIHFMNLTLDEIGTVTASNTGDFTYQLTIPISAAGLHQIVASNDVGNRAETQFKVLPYLKLNYDSAGPGDPVSASGFGFASSSTVTIIFGTFNVASVQTDELGSFIINFTVPSVQPYSYNIRAQDGQGNFDTAKFTVTAGASLSQSVGATGSELTVNGTGFTPGQTITISYDDTPVPTVPTVVVTDNNGDFIATFTIPAGGGKHVITVSGGVTTKKYTFTLEKDPPPMPVLLLPMNNSLTKAESYFDWADVADISVPVTYILEVASDQNFASVNLFKIGIQSSHYTLTEDDILTAAFKSAPYFWRVQAVDGADNESEWSATWVFYVSVPSIPTLTLPAANAKVELPIHFSWQSTESLSPPLTYNLQIAANPDFASPLLNKTGLTIAGYLISEADDLKFEMNMTYYWRVKAIDAAHNSSDWSTTGSFYFISTSGFPGWATYTLISVGGLIAIILAFRAGRRTAYH
jgi:hypothetical protein